MICNLGVVGSNPTRGSKRIYRFSLQSFPQPIFLQLRRSVADFFCGSLLYSELGFRSCLIFSGVKNLSSLKAFGRESSGGTFPLIPCFLFKPWRENRAGEKVKMAAAIVSYRSSRRWLVCRRRSEPARGGIKIIERTLRGAWRRPISRSQRGDGAFGDACGGCRRLRFICGDAAFFCERFAGVLFLFSCVHKELYGDDLYLCDSRKMRLIC